MPVFLRSFFFTILIVAGLQAYAQTKPADVQQRHTALVNQVEEIARTVREDDHDDAALQQLRTQLEPLTVENQSVFEELLPRLEAARQRLEQVGPKPEANAPPEPPETSKARSELQKQVDDLDAQARRARVLGVRIQQVAGEITNARRELLLGEIFKQTSSALNPKLWYDAGRVMPRVWNATAFVMSDWAGRFQQRLQGSRLVRFLGLVAASILAFYVLRRLSRIYITRRPREETPSVLDKAINAMLTAIAIAVLPWGLAYAIAELLRGFDLVSSFAAPLVTALLDVVRMLSIGAGIARGLFQPGRPNWRLLNLPDPVARRFSALTIRFVAVAALLRLFEAIAEVVTAPLDVSVAMRALLTTIAVLVLGHSVFGSARLSRQLDQELGPRITQKRDWFGLWQALIWAAIAGVIGANVLGYVNFANFLVTQIMWVTFLLICSFVLLTLGQEVIAKLMHPDLLLATAASTALGARPSALKQISILLSGVFTLLVYFLNILLILAPWGVESDSVLDTLQAAFFGFNLGAISFSMSSVVAAIILFALGFFATRAFQRWLEGNYLPSTELDSGLQNSITTSAGYVGVIAAVALPFAYLGFNFEKLAIVAGALSLGIGFGLQSIVANFVSGLILLWERAIKVGDWVVVGTDQGIVKRINVRSTEIETFERQTVIVPNSNMISGVVKNWVRMDRSGRLSIEVRVDSKSDPDLVRSLLVELAKEHRHVLDKPSPYVLFNDFGTNALHFDLRAFVDDVDHMGGARSDLRYEIFRRFRDAGIVMA